MKSDALLETEERPWTQDEFTRVYGRVMQACPTPVPHRRPYRLTRRMTAGLIAAALCATMLTAAAVPTVRQILQSFFQVPASYYMVGKSVERDGWTFTVTDCIADQTQLYLGIAVTAPESVALSAQEFKEGKFELEGMPSFIEAYGGSWDCTQVADDNPADNRISFALSSQVSGGKQALTAGGTFDLEIDRINLVWCEDRAKGWQRQNVFNANQAALTIPKIPIQHTDQTVRLTPNRTVAIYGGQATLTEITLTPLTLTVRAEGGSCLGHQRAVPTRPQYLLPGVKEKLKRGTIENTTCTCDFATQLRFRDGRTVFVGTSYQNNFVPSDLVGNHSGICEDGYTDGSRNGKTPFATSTIAFRQPLNLDEIEAVIVCDQVFPIHANA